MVLRRWCRDRFRTRGARRVGRGPAGSGGGDRLAGNAAVDRCGVWGEQHVDTASHAGDARRLAEALAEERWRDVWPLLHNDLEPPARALCADVDDALAALAEAGAIAPRLTGSGSACFALTRTFAEAQTLASRLTARHAPAGEARWPFVCAVRLPVGGGG